MASTRNIDSQDCSASNTKILGVAAYRFESFEVKSMAIPAHILPQLQYHADFFVSQSLIIGAPGCPKPSDEPSFVASVVLGAVPDIGLCWSSVLAPIGIRLAMTGVFCHASPKVKFSSTGRAWSTATVTRELGDLLIVHDHISGPSKQRQAVIIQAKVSSNGIVTSTDKEQLWLYSGWPIFESTYATFPSGKRDFSTATTAGSLQDCGRYGIIDTGARGGPDWWLVAPTLPPLKVGGFRLGSFMANMLDGAVTGCGREAIIGGTDHWSQTIEDLVTTTATRTFRHTFGRPGHKSSISGYRGVVAFNTGNNLRPRVSVLLGDYDPETEIMSPYGISLIHIITSQDRDFLREDFIFQLA